MAKVTTELKRPDRLLEPYWESAVAQAKFSDELESAGHGNKIIVKVLNYGQPRPYASNQYRALIYKFAIGSGTTNGPQLQTVSREDALAIFRICVQQFEDKPANWASPKLVYCNPIEVPVTKQDPVKTTPNEGRAYCWEVLVTAEYTD